MQIKYCIQCEKEVPVEYPIEGHSVIEFVPDEGTQEIFWCEGGFTECPPPAIDPNWEMNLVEPTGDALFAMAMAAEELLRDFEGE